MAYAKLRRGLGYSVLKKYNEALSDMTASLETKKLDAEDTCQGLFVRANIFQEMQNYGPAIDDYSLILKEYCPDDYYKKISLLRRGYCYSNIQKHKEAIEDSSRFLNNGSEDPEDIAEAYVVRADGHVGVGQYQEAIVDLTTALESGKLPKESMLNAYVTRCNAYGKLKKYSDAISDCSKAYDLSGNNENIYSILSEYKNLLSKTYDIVYLKDDSYKPYKGKTKLFNTTQPLIIDPENLKVISPFPGIQLEPNEFEEGKQLYNIDLRQSPVGSDCSLLIESDFLIQKLYLESKEIPIDLEIQELKLQDHPKFTLKILLEGLPGQVKEKESLHLLVKSRNGRDHPVTMKLINHRWEVVNDVEKEF